jgi:hypothetical protein
MGIVEKTVIMDEDAIRLGLRMRLSSITRELIT